ncbi:uroporphyrinogen decarboxylase family protein, partial [Deltaproteobacteria bacterium TL4]
WQIESIRFLNERLGDLSPFGKVLTFGPYYMYSTCLRGTRDACLDIKMHPDLAVEALYKLCDFIIDLRKYAQEQTNISEWMLIDSFVAPPFTSPEWFKRYCAPQTKRIVEGLSPSPGMISGAADFTTLLETYAEMGFKTFSFSGPTDLEKMRQVSDKYGILIEHWAVPASILCEGSPEEIEDFVKKCIKIAGPGKRYALSTESPDDDTPVENFLAVREACLKYGKYPITFSD